MGSEDSAGAARTAVDLQAVMGLQALYGETIDALVSHPGEIVASDLRKIVLPDAVIDFPGLLGRFEGIGESESLFGAILPAELAWMLHSFGSPFVEIAGERAKARWTFFSLVVRRGLEDRPPEAVYGRYVNRYVRTGEGWWQSSLAFVNEARAPSVVDLGATLRTHFEQAVPDPAAETDR